MNTESCVRYRKYLTQLSIFNRFIAASYVFFYKKKTAGYFKKIIVTDAL